nr:MAG TPA: hypothetical protein [Caudoviricetes sp.]
MTFHSKLHQHHSIQNHHACIYALANGQLSVQSQLAILL